MSATIAVREIASKMTREDEPGADRHGDELPAGDGGSRLRQPYLASAARPAVPARRKCPCRRPWRVSAADQAATAESKAARRLTSGPLRP